MLSDQQVQLLQKPFEVHEHGFLNRNPFIKKSAILTRLHKVDPAWSISSPVLVAAINDSITMSAGLTISGVVRHAVGTGLINRFAKDGVERSPGDIMRETSKAMKSADSDLLPRCASKFGVGAYLRDMTKPERDAVNEENSLKRFLEELSKKLPPVHWALNGGGERIAAEIRALKLERDHILQNVEQGRTLTRLSDTTLTEYQFLIRLHQLAAVDQLASSPADVILKTTSDPNA